MALTLRLSDDETKKLQEIMIETDTATQSGAIKKMIAEYQYIKLRLRSVESAWDNSLAEIEEMKQAIQNRNKAKQTVNNLQGKLTKWASKL